MVNRSFLLLFLLGTANLCIAQKQPGVAWQKALGGTDNDFGVSIAYGSNPFHPDSGYIVSGTTLSSNGDVSVNYGGEDIWLVKITGQGEKVWEKSYGGGRADQAGHIAPTSDGGYIVGGTTWPIFAPPIDTNSLQWWIFKIDRDGNMLWEKKYGGASPDNLTWLDIAPDGSIYCVGHSTSKERDFPENKGSYDIWVMKLTSSGDIIWKKSFGGSGEDRGTQIRTTKDGGCIIVGRTQSTDGDMIGNHGGADGFVAKLNSNGDVQWKKVHGTAAAESLNAVAALFNGGYVAVGITQGASDPNGDYDIVRLDDTGAILWEKFYGGSGRDEATAVLEIQGGVQVIGTSNSDIDSIPIHRGLKDFLVYRLDASGNTGPEYFSRWFGGLNDDEAGGALIPALPGYIVVGRTNSDDEYVDSHGSFDVWVVRYGGGAGIDITPNVNFSTVDTGKSTTQDLLIKNSGGEPVTVSFELANAASGQYSITDMGVPFKLKEKTDTTLTITFAPKVIGPIVDTLRARSSIGHSQRILLLGIGTDPSGEVAEYDLIPISVYPNPATEFITVEVPVMRNSYTIRIENTLGKEIKRFLLRDSLTEQYDIHALSSGTYVLSIYEDERIVARKKFVKK